MLRKFWYRTKAILPLVYDESLSYIEVLSKLVRKINEVIDYVTNDVDKYIRELLNTFFATAMYDETTETLTFYFEVEGVDDNG